MSLMDAEHPSGKNREDVKRKLANRQSKQELHFKGWRFEDRADLSEMELENANLENATMRGVNLWNTRLDGAGLAGADLTGAQLGRATLKGARLERAKLHYVDFYSAVLDGTNLSSRQLGGKILQEENQQFLEAGDVYRALKQNFAGIGAYDDRSWAYFKEKQMRRMSLSYRHAWKCYWPDVYHDCLGESAESRSWPWQTWVRYSILYGREHLPHWVWELMMETFWGYGERPQNIFVVCVVAVVLFALVFNRNGGFEASTPATLVDYMNYSLAAFVTMSYPGLVPVTGVAKLLSSLEAIVGVGALSAFLFALGQRIGRS